MNNAYYLEEPVTKGSFYFFAVKQTKKSDAKRHQTSNLLERVKGFEPSTHGLGSRYSTTELHPLELYRNKVGFLVPTDFIIAHEA